MLYIITNPYVYKAIQAEIDSTNVKDAIISDEEAKTVP